VIIVCSRRLAVRPPPDSSRPGARPKYHLDTSRSATLLLPGAFFRFQEKVRTICARLTKGKHARWRSGDIWREKPSHHGYSIPACKAPLLSAFRVRSEGERPGIKKLLARLEPGGAEKAGLSAKGPGCRPLARRDPALGFPMRLMKLARASCNFTRQDSLFLCIASVISRTIPLFAPKLFSATATYSIVPTTQYTLLRRSRQQPKVASQPGAAPIPTHHRHCSSTPDPHTAPHEALTRSTTASSPRLPRRLSAVPQSQLSCYMSRPSIPSSSASRTLLQRLSRSRDGSKD
jgi:hypothetical protein